MAIQKEKTLPNGAVGNYWRITTITIDRQHLRIAGQIALFKDQAASAAGAPPLGATKTFRFPFTMAEFLAAPNAVAFIYAKIKAKASELLSFDIHGTPIVPPIYTDPDIADGVDVL